MDAPALLAVFDEQMRRRPPPAPGESVEHGERVTRIVSAGFVQLATTIPFGHPGGPGSGA